MDEFGNSLLLVSNKLQIVKNDTNIKTNTQISTDLFYGRSILGVLAISKAVGLIGNYVAFYGQDEYFRCFDIRNGKKISAIEIDVNELIDIQRNANGSYKLPNPEIEAILKKEYSRYE